MVATIRGQMKLGVYEMGAEIFNKGWAAAKPSKNNSSNDRAQVKPKITITKGQTHSCSFKKQNTFKM